MAFARDSGLTMTTPITIAEYRKLERKPAKYRNRRAMRDGMRFDSELEARCYDGLKLLQRAGDVLWFIRQVPFVLEGGVVYRADFLAVRGAGVEVIDAKGRDTQVSRNKRSQVKARYGVDVVLWTDRGAR
jgi:hypothetical protein